MKARILTILALSLSLSLSPLLSQAEQIYRWVDDEGVTHFTAHPPKGRQSESVRTHTGRSEPVDYSSQYPSESREKTTGSQNGADSDSRQLSQEEIDDACQTARQNLEALQRGGRIAIETEDGSRRYLGEEEITERTETARQIVENAC